MKMKKLLCLVLSLLLVLSLAACDKKDSKKKSNKTADATVENYLDACIKGDFEKIINMQPEEVINEIKDEMDMDKDDWKDYIEDGQDDFEDYFENLEDRYGGKPKITYEITDQWSIDKDDDLFEEVQDEYDSEYDAEVSDVKVFEVELTMKAGGEKVERTITLYMVKIDGSWYPYVYTPDRFF